MEGEERTEELRKRYDLLEGDRKAFFEATQMKLRQNKDLIADLKEENMQLKTALLQLQAERGQKNPALIIEADIRRSDETVCRLRKSIDVEKHRTQAIRSEMTKIAEEQQRVDIEASDPRNTDTGVGQKMKVLEDGLDKATIRYNEAKSMQKTYNQIVECLRSERVSFDSQLAELENSCQAAESELNELGTLRDNATFAVDQLRIQLSDAMESVEQERIRRERALEQRRRDVEQLMELEDVYKDREEVRKNAHLIRAANESAQMNTARPAQNLEAVSKSSMYKDVMTRIADATGVQSVDEIVRKLQTREQTKADLERMASEAQSNIDALSSQCEEIRHKLEDAKFSGESGAPSMRRTIEEVESRIAQARQKADTARDRNKAVKALSVDISAGVDHLAGLVRNVRVPEGVEVDGDIPSLKLFALKIAGICEFMSKYHAAKPEEETTEDIAPLALDDSADSSGNEDAEARAIEEEDEGEGEEHDSQFDSEFESDHEEEATEHEEEGPGAESDEGKIEES
ncbi:Chromosome partition protein Smc [Carpediemonas membranifera]|uniref:Chromosome partition protein Smc n=1 Tax=Carpediemonas membranifera TaxID=201153 RepID=A0A8J6BBV0_9EUKA|nr:Chromosome partition protein Smc [Carpediemonas membranifera]|eukprot:KAG9397529.1 Chromosome partition protein Smc [Carpediemonas membranifera]